MTSIINFYAVIILKSMKGKHPSPRSDSYSARGEYSSDLFDHPDFNWWRKCAKVTARVAKSDPATKIYTAS